MKIQFLLVFCLAAKLVIAQDSTFSIYDLERMRKGEISATDLLSILAASVDNAIGKEAPPLAFQTLEDHLSHSLSEFRGDVVFLNFWRPNCRPCIEELPTINELQEDYESAGLRVIYLSDNDFDSQLEFYSTNDISGTKGRVIESELLKPYQTIAVPTSFLVDRKGTIRDAWAGACSYGEMESRLNKLIPREQKSVRMGPGITVMLLSVLGIGFVLFGIFWNIRRKNHATSRSPKGFH